jgi:hypothetical protein
MVCCAHLECIYYIFSSSVVLDAELWASDSKNPLERLTISDSERSHFQRFDSLCLSLKPGSKTESSKKKIKAATSKMILCGISFEKDPHMKQCYEALGD